MALSSDGQQRTVQLASVDVSDLSRVGFKYANTLGIVPVMHYWELLLTGC